MTLRLGILLLILLATLWSLPLGVLLFRVLLLFLSFLRCVGCTCLRVFTSFVVVIARMRLVVNRLVNVQGIVLNTILAVIFTEVLLFFTFRVFFFICFLVKFFFAVFIFALLVISLLAALVLLVLHLLLLLSQLLVLVNYVLHCDNRLAGLGINT